MATWRFPASEEDAKPSRSPARAAVPLATPGAPWKVPLRCTSTWRGTAGRELVERLARQPLEITVLRIDPPATRQGQPTEHLVGTTQVDLLPLVTQGEDQTARTTGRGRWMSGTYFLVHPTSRYLGAAKLRVKAPNARPDTRRPNRMRLNTLRRHPVTGPASIGCRCLRFIIGAPGRDH